ncbi:MAG TPA: hypothetical protein VGG60_07490 [Candidatus Binataceae bacterium]
MRFIVSNLAHSHDRLRDLANARTLAGIGARASVTSMPVQGQPKVGIKPQLFTIKRRLRRLQTKEYLTLRDPIRKQKLWRTGPHGAFNRGSDWAATACNEFLRLQHTERGAKANHRVVQRL